MNIACLLRTVAPLHTTSSTLFGGRAARQHVGTDDPGNLALACHRCNLRKGPNLTGIDPITGEIVPLFDPRRDRWLDHFRLSGAVIEGVTAVGRTTTKVLSMNDTRRIERRELLARRPDAGGGF